MPKRTTSKKPETKPTAHQMPLTDADIDESLMETIVSRVYGELAQMNLDHETEDEYEEQSPPEPRVRNGKPGQKEDREYRRFSVGIDSVLAGLFEREMRGRHLSAGKLLELILWNRYGRPKLSYMKDPEE